MSRHHLAIPAGSFLLISLVLPACAQTNPDNPLPAAEAAVAQNPKLPDEEIARLYLVRKQYREAQDIFHKLTVEHPKNAVYWNELGISLHNQTQLDSALKCYQKSAKLNPNYADPQNNIGTIYYARKKFAKAVRFYNKAIALRQDFAAFYLNLGYAYFGEKNYEQSIAAFRKALQIDPNTFDAAKSGTGTVVQDRSLGSDRALFYFLLAKSFAESGNAESCVLYLKKARDEGYQDVNSVKSDPSFTRVIKDPAVQEFLLEKAPNTVQP
jgi:tetratricopeptide (TPR) repeat protein